MSVNNIIADTVTRIRNAIMARHSIVELMHSEFVIGVLNVLNKEGYIGEFIIHSRDNGSKFVELYISYDNAGISVIKEIKLISKPGCRVYTDVKHLPRCKAGYGITIISTPKGIVSDREARDLNVGGEVICKVF